MQDILNFFKALLENISPDVVNFLAVLALVCLIAIVAYVGKQLAKNEKAQAWLKMFELFDDAIADAIVFVAAQGENIDMTKYEQCADEREALGLMYVDPRMLYVLDVAGDKARQLGLPIAEDEEALLRRAEHIFQQIKKDPELPDV